MKMCLGWMVLIAAVTLPLFLAVGKAPTQHGETSPYRLPELLPPASDPKPMDYPGWKSDPEVFVSLFEKTQALLSDYHRVWLLARAAEKYGNANVHPNFKRSGPARALIDLALKAARGAESSETIGLRRLRVRLAWEVHPDIGRRETDETQAEMNAIPVETVKILTNNDDGLPSPGDRERLKMMIERWDGPNERGEYLALTDRKVSSKLPRLTELPYQDPHTKSMSSGNPEVALSYEEVHRQHVHEFVGQQGFGIAREMVNDQRQVLRDETGSYWRVTRAHLISFLEREEPVAYQMKKAKVEEMEQILVPDRKVFLDSVPMRAMDREINGEAVPTRPLSEFEKLAFVKTLETGKPEIAESPTRTKMVAPILAEASCARCHELEVGDPLGAFSYEIEPDPSAANYYEPRYQRRLAHEKKRRAAEEKTNDR